MKLTLSLFFSQVDGIQGIMNAYNGALFNVSFAGPTLFGPVINAAATIASESLAQNAKRYYVLLIITVSLCPCVTCFHGSKHRSRHGSLVLAEMIF